MTHYKVAVFGAGFVGIPTASVLALHNPQIEVFFYVISVCRLRHQSTENIKMQKRRTPNL